MINLTDYNDFFIFMGGLLVIGGIIYFLFRHSLQNMFLFHKKIVLRFISEEEISKPKISKQVPVTEISFPTSSKNTDSQALIKKISAILLAIIIGAFLFNQFLIWRMSSSGILGKLFSISINITKK